MTRVHSHTRLRARFCISRSGSGYVATDPYGSESFIRPVVAHSSSFLSSTHIAFNIVRTQCNIASRRRQSREREERRAGPSKGTVFFTFLPFTFYPRRLSLVPSVTNFVVATLYTPSRGVYIYIYFSNVQSLNNNSPLLSSCLNAFPSAIRTLNSVGEIGESNTYL